MNKFTVLKNQFEELWRESLLKKYGGGQKYLNEINVPFQNGQVIGDDFLDEIRIEYFNSDFDSTNEEIENRLNEIGKEEEYKEYLENIIRDLKLESED